MSKRVDNSKGQIFYGMHFYPGVARYQEPDKEPLTVYINESAIRSMSPSFAGRPIFVDHVDGVDQNINELRKEADGWVVESFFNEKDGKTWAKFIVVSDRGLEAIKRGYRLSNAYVPKLSGQGGKWNGVDYQAEVVGGEFEHLAIVQNPRYDESVIMTPEQFKSYNEDHSLELKRLSNSNDKGDSHMGFKFFKRSKVENSVDLEGTMVELPKSKKEVSVSQALEEYDKILNMQGYASGDHMVKVNDKDEMSVNDLIKKHAEVCNELDELKKKNAGDADDEDKDDKDDKDKVVAKDKKENDDKDDGKEDKEKVKNEIKETLTLEAAKEIVAREKAAKLKNASNNVQFDEEIGSIDLPQDQLSRGKSRYGTS